MNGYKVILNFIDGLHPILKFLKLNQKNLFFRDYVIKSFDNKIIHLINSFDIKII